MCEFCVKHGEGKKWYLEAKNYSEDLLSDIRRRKFIRGFVDDVIELGDDIERRFDDLDRAPGFIRRMIRWKTVRKMKKMHYGQVIPIEDVEKIFDFTNSIVRIACICRHVTTGKEKRYCYGLSMGPNGGKLGEIIDEIDESYRDGPFSVGMEVVSKEDALASFKKYEKQGLCHSAWTFKTPFIGAFCNCDRSDCLAMRFSVTHDLPIMFRAEYVAESDPELCDGCRSCMQVCQFGAIGYSAGSEKSFIDQRRCYGCGVCRSVCKKNAIRLQDRAQVPVAADMW
jgi:Pyruvate/2-oxoacid:ferredoxin oxidoreductase delta subunit